jgi:hypothetical protein
MKDKIKTRVNELVHNPRTQGVLFGSVVSTAACVATLKLLGANFSNPATTLHIPDHIVEHILTTGLPTMITRHDGVQLTISPS